VNALDFVECYDPAVEDAGLIDAALFVHSVITYDRNPRFMVLNAKAGGVL